MASMPTRYLRLLQEGDGYHRTRWYDDDGKRHRRSFGKNRNKAQAKFAVFHTMWQGDPRVRNPDRDVSFTVRQLWDEFAKYAKAYYCHADGTSTGHAGNMAQAFAPALALFGDMLAADFGAKCLKTVRDEMVRRDWCLNVINQRIAQIRQVFKWAASEELAPAGVWHALQAVGGLQAGRSKARTTAPVTPVPLEHVDAVIGVVPATIGAMIEVQHLTGSRPGEVCSMRPIDLDTAGSVWIYTPQTHKTEHRGKSRMILLGPKCQEIIAAFLKRPVAAYLFSPIEAQRERNAARGGHRHQPVAEPKTDRRMGQRYTTNAYALAVRRACRELGIPEWSPNRLRHNAATLLRKEYGLDVAQIVLGHSKADVTQVYAERDLARAVQVMEKIG